MKRTRISTRVIALLLSLLMILSQGLTVVSALDTAGAGQGSDTDQGHTHEAVLTGDLDENGSVNLKDSILLFRYVAGWDVEVHTDAADMDGNGTVNSKDAILLFRYVSGWDVETGGGGQGTWPETEPESEPETEPPHEHTPVIDAPLAPTCNQNGLTEGSHCGTCGEILVPRETIRPLGHQKGAGASAVVTPTCHSEGYTLWQCARCGEDFTTDHTAAVDHLFGESVQIRARTCTVDGVYHRSCVYEGCERVDREVELAPGHAYLAILTEDEGSYTYVCQVCGHEKPGEGNRQAHQDESYASNCPSDFSFRIHTEGDEVYIREHLTVTDPFFRDAADGLADYASVGFILTPAEDGVWTVSSPAYYEKGHRYEAELTGDLTFADYKGCKLIFSVAAEERNEVRIRSDLEFIRLPDPSSPLYGQFSLTHDGETQRTYLRVPTRGRFDESFIGRIFCLGDYISLEELNGDPGRACEFGTLSAIRDAEDGSCLMVFTRPSLDELYTVLDVHMTREVELTEENLPENFEEAVLEDVLSDSEFLEFAARYTLAAERFAAANGLTVAKASEMSFFDRLKPRVNLSFEKDGEGRVRLTVLISGTVAYPLTSADGKDFGTFRVGFSVKYTPVVEIRFDGGKVYTADSATPHTYFNVGIKNTGTCEITFKNTYEGEWALGDSVSSVVYTPAGVYHLSGCKMVDASDPNLTTLSHSAANAQFCIDPDSCLKRECAQCRPFSDYLQKHVYVVNKRDYTVHRFTATCPSRLEGVTETVTQRPAESDGYTVCLSCMENGDILKEFDDYYQNAFSGSNGLEWDVTLNKLKTDLKGMFSEKESSHGLKIVDIPIALGTVATLNVALELDLRVRFGASLDTALIFNVEQQYGVMLDASESWKPYRSVQYSEPGGHIQIYGDVGFKVGLKGSMELQVNGFGEYLSAGLELAGGAYADFRGVARLQWDPSIEGPRPLAAIYFEAGFYADMSITARAFRIKETFTLFEKKFPMLVLGHHKVYYCYGPNPEATTVSGTAFNLGDYDSLKVIYFNVKELKSYKDVLVVGGRTGYYDMTLTLRDGAGNPHPYAYIDEETWEIRLREGAPCATDIYLAYEITGLTEFIRTWEDLKNTEYKEGSAAYCLEDLTLVLHVDNHVYGEYVVTREPTCSEAGERTRYALCGCTDENGDPLAVTESIPATGEHTWSEWTVRKEETCTEDGWKTRYALCACTDENGAPKTEIKSIPGGHIPVVDPAVEPTCTESGLTEGAHCGREGCGAILKRQEIRLPWGHAYADHVTCHDRPCTRTEVGCTHVEPATTPHDPTEPLSFDVPDQPALSFTARYCFNCGELLEMSVDSFYHHWDFDHMVTVLPTCSTEGSITLSCMDEDCGLTVSAAIPMLPHRFTVEDPTRPDAQRSRATCTDPATYFRSCAGCGALSAESDGAFFAVGEALGHKWSEVWSLDGVRRTHYHACLNECTARADEAAHNYNYRVKEDRFLQSAADCVMPDVYYYSCICGHYHTKVFESGEPLGHIPAEEIADWSADERYHFKSCPRCGQMLEETRVAHDFTEETVLKGDANLYRAKDCEHGDRYYRVCVCGYFNENPFDVFEVGTPREHAWEDAYSVSILLGTHYRKCGYEDCGAHKDEAPHVFDLLTQTDAYLKSAATCESAAVYYKHCACGYFDPIPAHEVEVGEPLGHDWRVGEWRTDDLLGIHYISCGREGCSQRTAQGFHSGGEATCITAAVCEICETVYRDALGHAADTDRWYLDPDNGTHYHSCIRCTYRLDETPHDYSEKRVLPAYRVSSASCTEPAVYVYSCVCGLAHPEGGSFAYGEPNGHKESKKVCTLNTVCTVCGDLLEAATGHNMAWVSANGTLHEKVCQNSWCDHREQILPHEWGETTVTVTVTCYREGKQERACGVCGYVDEETIPKLPHAVDRTKHYTETLMDKTHSTADVTRYIHIIYVKCGSADCTYREELARVENTLYNTFRYELKMPTCTADGYARILPPDGVTGAETYEEILHALGHDYGEDEVCKRCGYKEITYSEGLQFTSNGDGTCYVSGIGSCTDTEILIPPVSPVGDRVTGIGDSAFGGCGRLVSITVPEGVTYIGSVAFIVCTELTSVSLPSTLTEFGVYPFANCVKLSNLTVADGNPIYHSEGNCIIHTETGILALGCIGSVIPTDGSVTGIGNGSFAYSSLLAEMTIPDSVTSIGSEAFLGCGTLTDITIPHSLTSIEDAAFNFCTALTDVYYDGYKSEWQTISIGTDNDPLLNATIHFKEPEIRYSEGLEFTSNGDGTCYVSGIGTCTDTEILIPTVSPEGEAVVGIGDNAFAHVYELTGVTIPDRVTYIEDFAFYWCTALTGITIPAGVTEIGSSAFGGCESLVSLTVAEGNPVFHSDGNCIIHTSSKTLTVGCQTTVIPSDGSVLVIGMDAFDFCRGLTEFDIPEGVIVIARGAFKFCRNLTSVTIPMSVTVIEDGAFYECTSLTDVYYNGYESDWQAISVGTDNDPLLKAAIHFKERLPDEIVGSEGLSFISNGDGTCYLEHIGSCREPMFFVPGVLPSGEVVTKIESLALDYTKYSNTGNQLVDETKTILMLIQQGNLIGLDYLQIGASTLKSATSITIPRTVQVISDIRIFQGLSDIYYLGTEAEWNAIVFEKAYTELPGVKIHFLGEEARHVHEYTTITASPVCERDGYDVTVCVCGARKDVVPIAAKGHVIIYTEEIPPTCTQDGCIQKDCDTCLLMIKEVIPALGHDYGEDEVCKRCGYKEITYSEGLEFTSHGDGTCYVSGIGTCTDTEILIPTVSPEGEAVVGIGDMAFLSCPEIVSVRIHQGVRYIGIDAFRRCTGLVDISIPDSVVSIYAGAFGQCSSLKSITIPKNVENIQGDLFDNCDSLESIHVSEGNPFYHSSGNCIIETATGVLVTGCNNSVIPSDGSVTAIGNSAFYCRRFISTMSIPDSVTRIGANAFAGCTSLVEIKIPGGVTDIGISAFANTGIKEITVPESVKNMGMEVFAMCNALKTVVIQANVSSMPQGIFFWCPLLESVTIPSGVTSISYSAFYRCRTLADVYYMGTRDQWEQVTVHEANDPLLSATIHFKEPEIRYSEGLEFTSNGDGTCYVSGVGECYEVNILIPPVSPAGDTVTGIGDFALRDATNMMECTIPASVTAIGKNPFYYISFMDRITVSPENPVYHSVDNCIIHTAEKRLVAGCRSSIIPCDGSVTSIGAYAFYGSGETFTAIKIPGCVTEIGEFAFANCIFLRSVSLSDGLTSMGQFAFSECGRLLSIHIPASVSVIEMGVFAECSDLREIYLSQTVSHIKSFAFSRCFDLADVYYSGTAADWDSIMTEMGNDKLLNARIHFEKREITDSQGLEYTSNGDGTCSVSGMGSCTDLIVQIPSMSPEGDRVTGILKRAFFRKCIQKLILPEGITSIGDDAFGFCDSLMDIQLPQSLVSIGNHAFLACSGLKDVYYMGTQTQWSAVRIGISNDFLLKATVHDQCPMPIGP